MDQFAQSLFEGKVSWSRIRRTQAPALGLVLHHQQRLDAACGKAFSVDFIDVRRLERILVQALEKESLPQLPLPMPRGRFVCPSCVLAHAEEGQS